MLLANALALLLLLLARGPARGWLGRVGLPVFLLSWLLLAYGGLILVAMLLRGPGWSLLL